MWRVALLRGIFRMFKQIWKLLFSFNKKRKLIWKSLSSIDIIVLNHAHGRNSFALTISFKVNAWWILQESVSLVKGNFKVEGEKKRWSLVRPNFARRPWNKKVYNKKKILNFSSTKVLVWAEFFLTFFQTKMNIYFYSLTAGSLLTFLLRRRTGWTD